MASPTPLLTMVMIITITSLTPRSRAAFNCSGTNPRATCHALVGYTVPNATTFANISTLFGVKKLYDLLAANNIPIPSTAAAARATPAAAGQLVRVPFPCACANATGASAGGPFYVVKAGDEGLDAIARKIFGAIVTYQQIAAASGIVNVDLITVGQRLTIPIPCSCDAVDGAEVVHYGHVVESGSSVEGIAAMFGTTEATLLRLNGMVNASQLMAGQLLDVPLKVCSSSVRNDSLDSPLLVPNGTYALTAHQCVTCNCAAANNWTLNCKPSQLTSTQWSSCPSMQCNQSSNSSLVLGNSTGTCGSLCAYAGYSNQTILTALVQEPTCPANGASKMGLQAWSWNILLMISFHLVLLIIALF